MSNSNSNSNGTNTTAIRDNGKVNVERLAEQLLPTANTRLETQSTEAFLLDAFEKLFSRLHSVESESDDHESDFKRFTKQLSELDARLARVETATSTHVVADDELETSFDILQHAENVKSVITKTNLRDLDPDAADAIWRSVDSIQYLLNRAIAVASAA
jgi:hypothetical protein